MVDNTRPRTTVRRATLDDMQPVWQMLVHRMYPETGIGEIDLAKATQNIAEVFTRGYVIVAERDGEIIGSIGLLVGEPFWYSSDRALYDRWTFVEGEHRGKTFDLLINAAKDLSENGNIPLMTAVFTAQDTDRKNHLFRRKGLVPVGEIFVKGFDRCVSATSSAAAVAAEATPKP